MNNGFYALVFRQKYIRRWGLMRNSVPESLSEHTMEVAVIAHALAFIGNKYFGKSYDVDKMTTLALYHDVAEVYTGDLPTPIKHFNDNMRESYKFIEKHSIDNLLKMLPDDFREFYSEIFRFDNSEYIKIIKAADKLCAYIKCIEEEKYGNNEFRSAKLSTFELMNQLNCPELDYFIEHFLPAFELTIDELQKQ